MEGLSWRVVADTLRVIKGCATVADNVVKEEIDGDMLLSLIAHGNLEEIGAVGLQIARIEAAAASLRRASQIPHFQLLKVGSLRYCIAKKVTS
jgi:hypothetical protein